MTKAHPLLAPTSARRCGTVSAVLFLAGMFAAAPSVEAAECDITHFGAAPGESRVVTASIQAAIDRCAAQGGGRVTIPNGRFVSGTIFLRSNIELHLAHGAILQGSAQLADYVPGRATGNSHTEGRTEGLIVADNVSNAAITGFGTIDGNGEKFWDPGFLESGKSRPTLPRPMPWIEFRDSESITVRDTRFQHSPSFGLSFTRSSGIRVDDVRIFNDPRSPNTDGIQINDSARVVISGVHIATGDDAIVLKSDERDVTDVLVTGSFLTSDDTAFKLGTGSTKAIQRVTLRDSAIINSRIGIGLFMRRGGVYADLEVSNVRITGTARGNTDWPIYIDVDRRSAEFGFGVIRDIRFERMRIESRGNLLIAGNPASMMERISFNDVAFHVINPSSLAKAKKPRGNVMFSEVPGSVDYASENSHATFANIRGLSISDFRLTGTPEALAARTPVLFHQVGDAEVKRVEVGERAKAAPVFLLRASGGARLEDVRAKPGSMADFVERTQNGPRASAVTLCDQSLPPRCRNIPAKP